MLITKAFVGACFFCLLSGVGNDLALAIWGNQSKAFWLGCKPWGFPEPPPVPIVCRPSKGHQITSLMEEKEKCVQAWAGFLDGTMLIGRREKGRLIQCCQKKGHSWLTSGRLAWLSEQTGQGPAASCLLSYCVGAGMWMRPCSGGAVSMGVEWTIEE